MVTLSALAALADVVVECAPAAVFREVAEPALRAGRIFMPVSVGQLLEQGDLIDLAERTGARIIVPTGALLGLDAVRAAAEGEIRSITMVTRKPPKGLAGAPYLERHGIDLEGLRTPLKVFEGSARDGARGFPANVNVAAALSLAGIGPERTRLEIWADPAHHAQHASHRGRSRRGALRDADRERAHGREPAHRQDHRAFGDRGVAPPHGDPVRGQLIRRGRESGELMKIVLNGPVAHAGAAILRQRFGAGADVAEVDHRAADERAMSAFARAEILVSVDFAAGLPPMPSCAW